MDTKNLTIGDKHAFADKFLERYFENGLGSMTKREVDILVISLLMEHGTIEQNGATEELNLLGNNDLSILFQLSETRVKGLRYEAMLKYPPDENYVPREFMYLLAKSQFEFEKSGGAGKICFVMEDKYLRQAIQGLLKKEGMFADTTFNSEIVRISPSFLIEVIRMLLGQEAADEFADGFQQLIESEEEEKEELWPEIVRGFLKKMAEAGGAATGSAIFGIILGRLGITV
ncbi:MAG: hypothetical protein JW757_10005 [Anaerolineales bacterium]|nr:hypothetical protein [Anaerolineales bacterium]